MSDQNLVRKYFFIGLLLLSLALAATILWPFAKIIIVSVALAAIFQPVYQWILRRITKREWIAALLTIILFFLILCVPIFFIGSVVVKQLQSLYSWVVDLGGLDALLNTINAKLHVIVPGNALDARQGAIDLVNKTTASVGHMFTATLSTIISFLIVMLSMFYFLKDGARWKETLMKLSPLSEASDKKILSKLNLAVNGIVKGYLLIAVVQGVLAGVGMYIFGVPNPALWGVIAGIASLIPTLGTSLVAVPAIIFLFATGHDSAAIGFTIWSAIVVGTVDNFLNPLIVGRSVDIHPLLILFTILGGVALMGPAGILIGPLVISLVYSLVSIYKSEMA